MEGMSEDEKKIFLYTKMMTRINGEHNGNSEYYINKCNHFLIIVHEKFYGKPYNYPPKLNKKKNSSNRVSFAEKNVIFN